MSNKIFHNVASIISSNQAYLKRPHIHNLLEKSIKKPITTIVAGAGYGKTQAVYDFLQEYDAVTIWLQLSMFDDLPMRFWENFIYAVSLRNEELASNMKSLNFPETMEAYHRFLDLLSKEIKRDKKYVLVFDDFHLIHEKAISDFFERFIKARFLNFSFIFISRSEPDINIIGLLSKGLLSRITEENLRFNESEMIHYFQMQGIQLSSKSIMDIYTYTDGWIFAIHLVGLSLKKGLIHENYALSAAKENIIRLIENEIFSVISDELQEFLIRLSLIDNLPLQLLKEIFSDSDALIGEMLKISSFIRYDAFMSTYRIHHLFLSFLSEKQAALESDEKNEVYNKVANWYAKNGYRIDAITYYEKAKKYDQIFRIIISYPTTVDTDTAGFFLEILDRASKDSRGENYVAIILHARFLSNLLRFEEAVAELSELRKKYEALPQSQEKNIVLCDIYIVLAFASLYCKTFEFKKLFKMAYDTGHKISKYSLSMTTYACQVICSDAGAFDRFIKALNYAVPYVSELMRGAGHGYADLTMAELAFFQRDIHNAKKHASQSIHKARQNEQYHIESMAIFYLVRIQVSLGNYSEILDLLNQLKSLAQKQTDCCSIYDIAAGWFYSSIGQIDKVAQWIKNDMGDNKTASTSTVDLYRLVSARCYLAEEKYDEIITFIESNSEKMGLNNYLLGQIELNVLKAISLYHINKKDEAIMALQSAYDLASPNFLDMPFIEQGNHMRSLTRVALHNKNCTIPKQWLEMIYTKSSTYAKKLAHITTEFRLPNLSENDMRSNLTKKELELLTDLCHGLTREEIADNCNLSINTVKSMFQNIYKKLGAVNTLDAVRIATSIKLVK